jgi:colicin import membrane protein
VGSAGYGLLPSFIDIIAGHCPTRGKIDFWNQLFNTFRSKPARKSAAGRQSLFKSSDFCQLRPQPSGGRALGDYMMNKNVILGAAVIVAAGLGYYQFSYVPAQKAAQEAAVAAADAAAKAASEAKAAEEAAAKAAEEAAAKAAEELKAAEEAAQKAAEEAAAVAAEAAAKVEAEAKAAAEAAAASATNAASAVTEAVTGAADAMDPSKLLDATSFDAAKVTALIDGSSLDDSTKTTLKSAVEAAASNPLLLQGVLDQVKSAMGL